MIASVTWTLVAIAAALLAVRFMRGVSGRDGFARAGAALFAIAMMLFAMIALMYPDPEQRMSARWLFTAMGIMVSGMIVSSISDIRERVRGDPPVS